MKIIDILNIIARGEEPPKKIYFKDCIFEYDEQSKDYYDSVSDGLFEYYEITDILNDEIDILETTITYKQDKIEKIKAEDFYTEVGFGYSFDEQKLADKINEIIDHINKEV